MALLYIRHMPIDSSDWTYGIYTNSHSPSTNYFLHGLFSCPLPLFYFNANAWQRASTSAPGQPLYYRKLLEVVAVWPSWSE